MFKFSLISTMVLMFFYSALAQKSKLEWVDSVFQTLTIEEKVDQLFMVPVVADVGMWGENTHNSMLKDFKNYTPGGVFIVGRGGVDTTSKLIYHLQRSARIPLFIGASIDWGLGKVLDSVAYFQNPMPIAAIEDEKLLYRAGLEAAQQMKALGIQMNFAFGEPTEYLSAVSHGKDIRQTMLSPSFIRGLHRPGILVLTKNTVRPTNNISENQAVPFRHMPLSIRHNGLRYDEVDGMVFPDNWGFNKRMHASSAPYVVIKRLRKKGFGGLVFMQIDSLKKQRESFPREVEKRFLMAGGNMFICSENIEYITQSLARAATKNVTFRRKLYANVKKVLATKYKAGLAYPTRAVMGSRPDLINLADMRVLKNKLAAAAITVVQNDIDQIPIRTLADRRFASLSIGIGRSDNFDHYLNKFVPFKKYTIRDIRDTTLLKRKLQDFDVVVIGTYKMNVALKDGIISWINELHIKTRIILCAFSDPYDFSALKKLPSVVMAYTDEEPMPMLVAQLIFGACRGRGKLPVGVNSWLVKGQGQANDTLDRLGYSNSPESVGMDGATLERIDKLAKTAIDSGATPGCVVLIAKDGKVIFERAYGWHTYDRKKRVAQDDIYDLASITKVAATLQAVATLYDSKRIDIDKKASTYLPELKYTNKANMTIKNILTHQAGLWPFLLFWKKTVEDSIQRAYYYDTIASDQYPFPVAKKMFARHTMKDSLWHWIVQARLRKKIPNEPYDYLYSDMGFYIMHHLVEKQLQQPMEEFLARNLYSSLGAYTTGYLPLNRFPTKCITPTERDTLFRKGTLTGYVHDQGAAMCGGVAGHAGLFSNANDLAKVGQLWLQHGHYGGEHYFTPSTVRQFTLKQYPSNRRGLGWDKPTLDDWYGPTSIFASPKTFGHTGFTGTAIWMDPVFNTVFVFLSNHVYPDASNKKLLTANIRTRIQDVIYLALFNYCACKTKD